MLPFSVVTAFVVTMLRKKVLLEEKTGAKYAQKININKNDVRINGMQKN